MKFLGLTIFLGTGIFLLHLMQARELQESSVTVHKPRITIDVKHNIATLEGKVDSNKESFLAERAALSIAGIDWVENKLVVAN